MDSLGTFVENRYEHKTPLSLADVAVRLAKPATDYNPEPPKQVSGSYLITAVYRYVSAWRPISIRLEQDAGKVVVSIQTPFIDGRSEKHILNEVAGLLENRI